MADMPYYLQLMDMAPVESGICLVQPHMSVKQAGLLVRPTDPTATTVHHYLRNFSAAPCFCPPSPRAHLVELVAHDATCRKPPNVRLAPPRWDAAKSRLAVSFCSAIATHTASSVQRDPITRRLTTICPPPAYRPLGAVVLDALDFLSSHWNGSISARHLSLVLRLSRGHSHTIAGVKYWLRKPTPRMRPSHALEALANAIVRRHLGTCAGSHAAVMRISYAGGSKQTPHEFREACLGALQKADRFAYGVAMRHGSSAAGSAIAAGGASADGAASSCLPVGYLALDWFATADQIDEAHNRALGNCWDAHMGNVSAAAWWWPPEKDERVLGPLVRMAAPSLLYSGFNGTSRARAYSPIPSWTFRAFSPHRRHSTLMSDPHPDPHLSLPLSWLLAAHTPPP